MNATEQRLPRSAGTRRSRRPRLAWPADREFRILSIDGGGIRGIFPAAILAGLEERFLGGASVAAYFDLIAGTSTGGILALGLGADLPAAELLRLYVERGCEIFPPLGPGFLGRVRRHLRARRRYVRYIYEQNALVNVLREILGDRLFGSSSRRLCVPSFEGRHGEVYIFKTPHHPDFKLDWSEPMLKVALATSAAPSYYRPLQAGDYTFVDGGVWANNPVMIALTEALSSFHVRREQIRMLSLGCGEGFYNVAGDKLSWGGMFQWRDIISAAMRLQSQNALGQTSLLIGPGNLIRVEPPPELGLIELDDWRTAIDRLPAVASTALDNFGSQLAARLLHSPAEPYSPLINAIAQECCLASA
jgi:hypothetical protein